MVLVVLVQKHTLFRFFMLLILRFNLQHLKSTCFSPKQNTVEMRRKHGINEQVGAWHLAHALKTP